MTTVLSLCKCFPGKLNGDGKVLKESLVGVKVKLLVFDQLSADRRWCLFVSVGIAIEQWLSFIF